MEEQKIPQRPTTGKTYSIIDLEKNPTKKIRISSPKSLKAMQQLGYTNQDLDYISFQEFLNSNPDLSNSNKDLQKKRYQYLENMRKERIEEIISLRETITRINSKKETNEVNTKSNSTYNRSYQNMNTNYIPFTNSNTIPSTNNYYNTYNNINGKETYNNTSNNNRNTNRNFTQRSLNQSKNSNKLEFKSTAIENQMRSLERMKNKSEMELIGMIQYELKRELMKKQAEEKIRRQEEKLRKYQLSLKKKRR